MPKLDSMSESSEKDQSNSTIAQEALVVKVCDVNDIVQQRSAVNEKNILEKLRCPYINKYIGFYEDPFLNKAYLVLESAGDRNLADFVKDQKANKNSGPVDELVVRSIMKQLFQATDYLHSKKICHRDLKPDNILLTQGSAPESVRVKVIDFNVAVKLDDETQIQGGTGLKEWSAPETRLQLFTDYKIDCWTLGCVMYLLCTGQ